MTTDPVARLASCDILARLDSCDTLPNPNRDAGAAGSGTNAYKLSTVNLLQPFDYTAIIWAITFGLIFFNDYPDRYVIIGSIVIVISTYYIIYREAKLGKKINKIKINRRQI